MTARTNSLWLALTAVILAASCPAREPAPGSNAQRGSGKELYSKFCVQCHGEDGDGEGVAKAVFQPSPRDFTSGSFKDRTTESGELPTDADLRHIIKAGMPYTGMPAWPALSDQELANLVYYIKTFNEDFTDPDMLVDPMEFPEPPPYSAESAKLGAEVFKANQCIDCHGAAGRGDGESAPTLTDDSDTPIRPADLTKRWTFRGGPARHDIYRTFTTGLDGTPMPSYADSIEPDERWQLVDYIVSLGPGDEPDYGTMVTAEFVAGEIDATQGKALFDAVEATLFPVIGQVIEPGRAFAPAANSVSVKAVYNDSKIAILVAWHDMQAETDGGNGPDLEVPPFDPDAAEPEGSFSDAVAIQLPAGAPHGARKPYFIFGDKKSPAHIWFADLAKANEAQVFLGKGSHSVNSTDGNVAVSASYTDGEWSAVFVRELAPEDAMPIVPGSFAPIAFSTWDGFSKERGNRRGLTSWYTLYLKPQETISPIGPAIRCGIGVLIAELLFLLVVRARCRSGARLSGNGQENAGELRPDYPHNP